MSDYRPADIEPKWQKIWDETGLYESDLDSDRDKYIAMSMFNYPSGAGIHIGHAMNYTISEVMARFKRQQGYESYHPVGWDSFGLPAENYAIKKGVSPQQSMAEIIPSYHEQYKAMGWSNDWSKEIATHEPVYYKWTQWIFSEMYRNGLAYQSARKQWWCDQCQTVLANEQVIDGKCWRHEGADEPDVEQREVKQWFFKITEYADELLEAIEDLDWTDSVKSAQRNWIGRSNGVTISFKLDDVDEKIDVYTTRPDTLFGATYMVLAPEHELVDQITTDEQSDVVGEYIDEAISKTELERKKAEKEKTGVFTGAYAINPVNDEKIPVWIADYVLMGYGTGAIMAVPAHDERDYEFAQMFDLPIRNVIIPETGEPQANPEFRRSIVAVLENDNGQYLSINWGKKHGGHLFVGGGVEKGEDPVEAARREITEETGYTDFELVKKTGIINHNYFAHSKDKARRIEATGYVFRLRSEEQQEQSLADKEEGKFKIEWLSAKQVESQVEDELHQLVYQMGVNNHVYAGDGTLTNSGDYDGLTSTEVKHKIVEDLAREKAAEKTVNYRMRDWSVSRQRYWGAPIPIVHCDNCGPVLVSDEQLPIELPVLEDFQPSGDGRSALARAEDWLNTECPDCGGAAERETDTLDTYICSSWYMLRYFDPQNPDAAFDPERAKEWMPIDFYNGADHATAHLLYARFITRFFYKQGLVDDPEPFKRFLFNGKVTAADGTMFSKSKGNGVDPLEIINDGYGADSLRLYIMFAGPLDQWVKWSPQGVPGTFRYLGRVWDFVNDFINAANNSATHDGSDGELEAAILSDVHRAIKKVTTDIENIDYNTAIAAQMKLNNQLRDYVKKLPFNHAPQTWRTAIELSLSLLAPFAPHITEELWQRLGHEQSIHIDTWPEWDPELVKQELVTIVVQINGKLRGEFTFESGASESGVVEEVSKDDKIAGYLTDGELKKTIFVADKLINFVVV